MWTPLIILTAIIIINSIVIWGLTKQKKIEKDDDTYKKLNFYLIMVPVSIAVIYFVYIQTDTFNDWIIASIIGIEVLALFQIYDGFVEKSEEFNPILFITISVLIFVLLNALTIFLLSSTIKELAYPTLVSIIGMSAKYTKNGKKIVVIGSILFVFFIVANMMLKYEGNIKSKPIRIADKYITEEGYDLDGIDELYIDKFNTRDEIIDIHYIEFGENEYETKRIIKLEYYKGKIRDSKIETY